MEALEFWVNGTRVVERSVAPTTTLLAYLREHLHLTGTKEGCAEGDCGACTVAFVSDLPDGTKTYRAVNACLVLLPMVQGRHLVTIEGLRDGDRYHPVQASLVEHLGSQCGYCTPGVVMSMFEACYRSDLDAPWKVDDQMCGNLCRCTGYRPIRAATQAIAGARPKDALLQQLQASQDGSPGVAYQHGTQWFETPTSFEALWDLLDDPEARLIAGGTDLSLEVTKRFEEPPFLVSLEGLPRLRALDVDGPQWRVGSAVSLTDLEARTEGTLPSLERMLRFFGSRQIKNRGTVGGNLCNASPIGDLPPILIALGAKVVLESRAGERALPLEDFFLDYRKTALAAGEILTRVEFQAPPEDVRVAAYKVSKRQELDISAVSCGLWVETDAAEVVTTARFAYGGMAAVPKRATHVENAVIGKPWTEAIVEAALVEFEKDFTPLDDHRGSAWYRGTVAANLLHGFFFETQVNRSPSIGYRPTGTVSPEFVS